MKPSTAAGQSAPRKRHFIGRAFHKSTSAPPTAFHAFSFYSLFSTPEPKNGPFSGILGKWIFAILPLKNEVGRVGKKWEKPRFQI
jgi:hypothetical protein